MNKYDPGSSITINTKYFGKFNFTETIDRYSSSIHLLNSTLYNKSSRDIHMLIYISNPINVVRNNDINLKLYNTSLFFNECLLNYEIGTINIINTGNLNKSNIRNYKKIEDKTDLLYPNNSLSLVNYLLRDSTFLSIYDYPDIMINLYYNETVDTTLNYINDIIMSHMLSYLDTTLPVCNLTDKYALITDYSIVTVLSLGYIIISLSILIIGILILIILNILNKNSYEKTTFTKPWVMIYPLFEDNNKFNKELFLKYSENIYYKKDSKEHLKLLE